MVALFVGVVSTASPLTVHATKKGEPPVLWKLKEHLVGSAFQTAFGASRINRALTGADRMMGDLSGHELRVSPLTLDVLRKRSDILWQPHLYLADASEGLGFLAGTELEGLFIGSLAGSTVGHTRSHKLVVERRNLTGEPTSDWWNNPLTRYSVVVASGMTDVARVPKEHGWIKLNIRNETNESAVPGEHASDTEWQELARRGVLAFGLDVVLDDLPKPFKDEVVGLIASNLATYDRSNIATIDFGKGSRPIISKELGLIREGGDGKSTPLSLAGWFPNDKGNLLKAFNVMLFGDYGKLDTAQQSSSATQTRYLEVRPAERYLRTMLPAGQAKDFLFSVVDDTTHVPSITKAHTP